MKALKLASLSFALLLVAGFAAAGNGQMQHGQMDHSQHGKMMSKQVTLEGEVLDLYCYMKHPETGQGPEHAKCAAKCINKGLPIGLKVGDEVYLVVGKEHESAANILASLAGKQARIKGTLFDHDGVKAIELESAEGI